MFGIGTQSLVLNESVYSTLPEDEKQLFILDWLRKLEHFLPLAPKSDIKSCQKQLIDQLIETISSGPGVPARNSLARSMTSLFVVGDTIHLFETVNKLNDTLRTRDESNTSLQAKLAAVTCLGEMYQKLGRMMGRSYEETVSIISKSFKNYESQLRIESMITFEKICYGMDTAASSSHKDIYKIARSGLCDRAMSVRSASAQCLIKMSESSSFLYTTELENLCSNCLRALDGADYDARISIAQLLGTIIAATQSPNAASSQSRTNQVSKVVKPMSLDESLNILMTGFLRGASSFLKSDLMKGGSSVTREVRVGVAYAYLSFVDKMGGVWLEKHLESFSSHVLELVANPKAAASHVDSVYSRKCVNFILRRAFGRNLDEKAQFSALKVISHIIQKQMSTIDFCPENAKETNQETIFNQHLLTCSLTELSALFLTLSTSITHLITDPSSSLTSTLFSTLSHPSLSTRLAGAWALRSLCLATPCMASGAVDKCLEGLDKVKGHPEAISGYAAALAAILGAVGQMPLGVPFATGKIVFNTAEELLRTASQNSRLSIQKSNAGWLLIGSIMTLGNNVVKGLLQRMLLLWRNSFPKSSKDLESEKARGDAFTWQVTLETRAGALSSMHSFLLHCPDLVTDEIITRLLVPIESALAMMTNISTTLKGLGQQLKASAANLRYRLYQTLVLIKPHYFERSYTHMLRFVIWELTLNDNAANTTTSLFSKVCQSHSIFNSLISDHMSLEDQLQPVGAAGFGTIEHDICSLYYTTPALEECAIPLPLPLGVSVIDASIELFGSLYPHISQKHRAQLIDHFSECLKLTKYARRDAVLVNIFCAFLCAMKSIRKLSSSSNGGGKGEGKNLGTEELKIIAEQLVFSTLGTNSTLIRCAAAEVLGRIAQCVADSKFTTEVTLHCSDKLKSSREVFIRTSHSLALGCLHRYLGGMDSSRHQHSSVSILLNLAQDSSSPETQMWSLHSLALIADTGGPLFRSYVNPCLSLLLKLILNVPLSSVQLRQATGKLLAALITGFGPELQVSSDKEGDKIRKCFETGCAILSQEEEHPLVQNEAVTCYQRLHLFGSINFNSLIPVLLRSVRGDNLALRRTAVDCFRQLTQRDAQTVSSLVDSLTNDKNSDKNDKYDNKNSSNDNNGLDYSYAEYGLNGLLFSMMDKECDGVLRQGLVDTISSVLGSTIHSYEELQRAIALCKTILTADSGGDGTSPEDPSEDLDDDVEEFRIESSDSPTSLKITSRWTSRVYAAQCVRKFLVSSPLIGEKSGPQLLRHLADLIRMSFMGATSNSDHLRLEGLLNLETVIQRFSHVEDPDFPTASILEQFQAQVSAALRPAFSNETDPYVRSTAVRVCSTWICANSRGGEELRRVTSLLLTPLFNIKSQPTLPAYNEKANTLEKLGVLKGWAGVFVTSVENGLRAGNSLSSILQGGVKTTNHLLELVKPHLNLLSPYWLSALRDRALLELPPEYASQLPREGGVFFSSETKELVRDYYEDAWSTILYSSAICMATLPQSDSGEESNQIGTFHLLFGMSMEALCKPAFSESIDSAQKYLKSLWALFCSHWPRQLITTQKELAIELCSVLHRQLLTRSSIKIQTLVVEIVKLLLEGMRENFKKSTEVNETKLDDELEVGKSLVVSILEVIFCLLIQKIPGLNSSISGFHSTPTGTDEENDELLAQIVNSLEILPDVCNDTAAIEIQPTILYLSTCILSESRPNNSLRTSLLSCFKKMATHPLNSNPLWEKYLLSTLAKLLDLAKTGGDENNCFGYQCRIDLLSAISIFIKESPPHLIRIAEVIYPAINLYQQGIRSNDDISIRVKSMSLVCDIFESADRSISTSFIHALGPRILEYLYSEEAKNIQNTLHLEFNVECIRALQILVKIAESSEKRVQMLTMIVPVLISFIEVGSGSNLPIKKQLNEISLAKLMKIGPQYPQEFRMLMSQSPEMRSKLESAIKTNSQNLANKQAEIINASNHSSTITLPGTIKLKTDFSNFSTS